MIALGNQEQQVFSPLPQTDETRHAGLPEQSNKEFLEEELYVNVAPNSCNYNNYDDQKYTGLASYDNDEHAVNSQRPCGPPVPQRSLSLESFQFGESLEEHTKQGLMIPDSNSSDDQTEQRLMTSDDGGFGDIPLPSPTPPAPPVRSLSLESVLGSSQQQSNELLPDKPHGKDAFHMGPHDLFDGQASDDEGV